MFSGLPINSNLRNNSGLPLGRILVPAKRKVFISYHHKDQIWVDSFKKIFAQTYELFNDCSLDKAIESNDLHYVNRTIREDYITGTSITIVVCGDDTWKRKCVDWEIFSTLNKNHALLAIPLPHNRTWENGQEIRVVPDRVYKNIQSGYAHWIDWTNDAITVKQAIEYAISLSLKNKASKRNSDPKMSRNI